MDDDGLAYFLSTPSHYVKDALNPPSAKLLSCDASNKAFIERTSLIHGVDGVATMGRVLLNGNKNKVLSPKPRKNYAFVVE